MIVTEGLPENVIAREVIFQLELECVKNVVRHKKDEDSDFVDMYFTLAYLPEILEIDEVQGQFGGLTAKHVKTVKSPLWKTSPIENCINSQLVFRISGNYDGRFEKEFYEEFSHVDNVFRCPYISLSERDEQLARRNCLHAIETLGRMINMMPFSIHYTLLCLFSTKAIKILDFSFSDFQKSFGWILKI